MHLKLSAHLVRLSMHLSFTRIALAGIALAGNSINTITNGSNIVYKQRHK